MEVIGAQIQMQKRSCQNILFSSVNISGVKKLWMEVMYSLIPKFAFGTKMNCYEI